MALSLSAIPTDRVVWIRCFRSDELDRAIADAPPDAPVVIVHRTGRPQSQSELVGSALDELEATADQLFPAWLPGAEGIGTPAGAGLTAIRALALAHAAGTAQYGPFLADLAAGALVGRGPRTRRYQPEVRALGLARVLAASFGRSACALLLRPPDDLDERAGLVLVQAAQWLVDHGRFAVWIDGGTMPESGQEAPVVDPGPGAAGVRPVERIEGRSRLRREPAARRPRQRSVVGKPHPGSHAELVLEAVLADRPWAAGRAWNHTVRPGTLVNPVRVDLLWKRERCIVEIDGDDHRAAGKYAEDRHRDVMLQLNGYAVLRFTNTQVLDDIENVLALLHQFLANRRRPGKGT